MSCNFGKLFMHRENFSKLKVVAHVEGHEILNLPDRSSHDPVFCFFSYRSLARFTARSKARVIASARISKTLSAAWLPICLRLDSIVMAFVDKGTSRALPLVSGRCATRRSRSIKRHRSSAISLRRIAVSNARRMIAGNTNECVAAMICSISWLIAFPDVTPFLLPETTAALPGVCILESGLRFANGLYE